jgi:acyl-coenzyme A synthetase/AMP-(fatty) acid ligase
LNNLAIPNADGNTDGGAAASTLLTIQAQKTPENIAVQTGETAVSYAQFEDLVQRCAVRLSALGLGDQQVCALAIQDQFTLLVVWLGLNRLNVGSVCLANRLATRETTSLFDGCATKVVLTDQADEWPEKTTIQISLAGLGDVNLESSHQTLVEKKMRKNRWEHIVLGSGSTGQPKLIAYEFGAAMRQAKASVTNLNITSRDRFYSFADLQYGTPITYCLMMIAAGGSVVLPKRKVIDGFLLLEQRQVTLCYATAFHAEMLCVGGEKYGRRLPKLRDLELSASVVTDDLITRLRRSVTDQIVVAYDANECWPLSRLNTATEDRPQGSVGGVVANSAFEIVDDNGKVLPNNCVGAVRFRAAGMFSAYLGQPQETAKVLKDGWFYPGDVGKRDDNGHLILLGRSDQMMIYNGINIYPIEIENVMADHPAVSDAAVMKMSHAIHQDVPVCAVTLHPGALIGESDLLKFGRKQLGSRAAKLVFVVDAIPRNALGKLMRAEMAKALSGKLEQFRAGLMRSTTGQ